MVRLNARYIVAWVILIPLEKEMLQVKRSQLNFDLSFVDSRCRVCVFVWRVRKFNWYFLVCFWWICFKVLLYFSFNTWRYLKHNRAAAACRRLVCVLNELMLLLLLLLLILVLLTSLFFNVVSSCFFVMKMKTNGFWIVRLNFF